MRTSAEVNIDLSPKENALPTPTPQVTLETACEPCKSPRTPPLHWQHRRSNYMIKVSLPIEKMFPLFPNATLKPQEDQTFGKKGCCYEEAECLKTACVLGECFQMTN